MYPLIQLGPLNLSSGGLLLLAAILFGTTYIERVAARRGGAPLAELASRAAILALIGGVLGARLWYGVFNWDLYGRNPELFVALRIADVAWPGALIGGILAAWLWGRRRGIPLAPLADAAALTLPLAQTIACAGLLLSGEAFGLPTALPWGVDLFGTTRHPTQIYFAVAALLSFVALRRLARRTLPAGMLFAFYLGLQGLTLLLIEPLRADSLLLPYGVRVAQVFGLACLLGALVWRREHVPAAHNVRTQEAE
jgi:phosphatidylglycerol:prolipoprotein diacylglycerol transferase